MGYLLTMIKNMTAINEAAATIAESNKFLAHAFLTKKWMRADIAFEWANKHTMPINGDMNPVAESVIKIAMLDRERRKLQMELAEKM